MRYKVSGAIAISKASWGCAPALPNRIRVVSQEQLLLEKTVFCIRQKGVPPLLLPTSVLQLPRCLVWIYSLDSHDSTLFEFDSFKKCNCSRKNRLQYLICFANVGCSPTPRQHFWKTAAPKNFFVACGSYSATNLAILLYNYEKMARCNRSAASGIFSSGTLE